MMRLAWLTDIHLNFLDSVERRQFLETVAERADAVAITGDIGESVNVIEFLKEMEEILRRPIYFVLGNHDVYRGSIGKTRDELAKYAKQSEFLVDMTATSVVALSPETALIGHDGWADARLGDFENSTVFMNDHMAIQDFRKWEDDSTHTSCRESPSSLFNDAFQSSIFGTIALATRSPKWRMPPMKISSSRFII